MTIRKKLIEVALPLDVINVESLRRKQKAPKGWPTSFHKWWAQRPLAAARAVIFAQMVDDPSSWPDLFQSEKAQEKERQRLFKIIEDLVQWDNSDDPRVLQAATDEIWRSWRRACAENTDDPQAKQLYIRDEIPPFHDPFAGSGSIPLSAQWLGLESLASDLNPVAVLINKAVLELPFIFKNKPPVNPSAANGLNLSSWTGSQGLAVDVRFYGHWMRVQAEKRLAAIYPTIEISPEMVKEQPELAGYLGRKLTVAAWIWARTVKSPNPAFRHLDVPIVSGFLLSSKAGKEVYVEPILQDDRITFRVRKGKPADPVGARQGTKLSRGAFSCFASGAPIPYTYIDDEANAGRLGSCLMAIVAEGDRGRVFISPTKQAEELAKNVSPEWKPDLPSRGTWGSNAQGRLYGFRTFGDYFTPRQLVGLNAFVELTKEAREQALNDAINAGLANDGIALKDGGNGATAYADAISVYLACVLDRMTYYGSSLTTWLPKDNALRDCMPRQGLAMSWDFAEANPLGKSSADITTCTNAIANYLEVATPNAKGIASLADAQKECESQKKFVISTDPPYYDNIGYADLADYFYAWLRPALRDVYPGLFATLATPKAEELVATQYRHGGRDEAEYFFLEGMTRAMQRLAERSHPAFPITIYYAFKQSEEDSDEGVASTGWQTFLGAVITAGFSITGTWPLRTEGEGRMVASGTNALASSIVLVCRPRAAEAPIATRREFLTTLQKSLPEAVANLQRGNIAPVDLQQAAIGPGMAIYTRYSKVIDSDGKSLSVRDALTVINQALDEILAHQEADFDADTRWALIWFEENGFMEGAFGRADDLARAKNTSVQGVVDAGIAIAAKGKARLLRPEELPIDWSPEQDKRLTIWDIVHHLIRVLDQGEAPAAALLARIGTRAEVARELAYRLFSICDRTKRSQDALRYNALVQSWPELVQLSQRLPKIEEGPQQTLEGMD